MTDLNNLAPAAPAAGASLPAPSASPAAPPAPPTIAAAAPAVALSPTPTPTPLDPVATALLGLHDAVDAAHTAATSLADSSVLRLSAALTDLADALQEIVSQAAEVGTAVSSALAPVPSAAPAFAHMVGPWIAGRLYGVIPAAPLTAVPDANEKWFAITRGKYVGLTKNSAISLNAVNGISSGLSDRCTSQTEALDHFNAALAVGAVMVIA